MTSDAEQFLEIYAKVLNTFDPKKLASFFLPPTIIMNDDNKLVMNSEKELVQAFGFMFEKFNQAGIKSFVPKLQQTMRLSDTLFFFKLRWQFLDEKAQLSFGCATSYTLQKLADNQFKIIVVVNDDDENKLADIFDFMSDL